jgi:small subunit ribosomal protein S4
MGDIKKKRKMYSKPRQIFNKARIDEENILVKDYGLKAKREIWKAKSMVSRFRKLAKGLISADEEKKTAFFEKLNKMGIPVSDISGILALTEKDWLDRRLQTIIFKKKLVATPQQARQLIVHRHVLVDGKIVNTPSFLVTRDLEGKISLKEKKVKPVKKEEPANKGAASEETPSEETKEENVSEETKK